MTPAPHLLLYDGLCALCDGAVRFLLRIDRRGAIRFAPLGGETAATVARRWPAVAAIDSVALVSTFADGSERVALRSAAVIGALRAVGGVWTLLAGLLWLAPGPLRDRVYDLVARRRKRWFGTLASCPPPPAAARARFLP